MTDSEDDKLKRARMMATFITLPFVLAVPPIVGWAIGSWLDKYFGISPWFMYIMLIMGFIAGIREFYRIIKKYGNGQY